MLNSLSYVKKKLKDKPQNRNSLILVSNEVFDASSAAEVSSHPHKTQTCGSVVLWSLHTGECMTDVLVWIRNTRECSLYCK